jgi:hypothetical protein
VIISVSFPSTHNFVRSDRFPQTDRHGVTARVGWSGVLLDSVLCVHSTRFGGSNPILSHWFVPSNAFISRQRFPVTARRVASVVLKQSLGFTCSMNGIVSCQFEHSDCGRTAQFRVSRSISSSALFAVSDLYKVSVISLQSCNVDHSVFCWPLSLFMTVFCLSLAFSDRLNCSPFRSFLNSQHIFFIH